MYINSFLELYKIFDILATCLAIYILYLYFGIFFEKKPLRFKTIVVYTIYLLWQILGVSLEEIPMYGRLLITILLVMMICEYCYTGKRLFKVIITLLISAIWTLMEFLVGYIFVLSGLNYQILQLSGALLSKALTLILVVFLRKFYKHQSVYKLPIKYSVILLLVPVGSLYLIYNIFQISVHATGKNTIKFSVIGLLVILAINITAFYLQTIISKELELQRYNTLYSQQIRMYQAHMIEKEFQVKTLRKERHDTKQHYMVLQAMAEQKHYIELEQYLSNLLELVYSTKKEISNTENLVIDALVNNKLEVLRQEIKIVSDIHVPADLEYEAADLGVLLGNILDNAIEALERIKENRYIKLFIKYECSGLFITCINSYDGILNKNKNGEIVSRKKENENHGFGLFSIKAVVDKYHGAVVLETDDGVFKIKVYLPAV